MATIKQEQPLIVIVGPTASGKTALAIELAERHGGEIVCADSRTVYKDMDIGTAKPTAEERARVPHHLLDVVLPGQAFSVADFQRLTNQVIADIRSRGKIPFLVGGSGLYVDSVIFDYKFGGAGDRTRRKWLEEMTVEQLLEYCVKNNIKMPENYKNKRYLMRAIERKDEAERRDDVLIRNCVVVGISTNKAILQERIKKRAEGIFNHGVVEEAIRVGEEYGWDNEAMTGNVYRLAAQVQTGELTIEAAKQKCATLDWQLAKRQLTWFKRNPYIVWYSLEDAVKYIDDYLDKGKHATMRTRELYGK